MTSSVGQDRRCALVGSQTGLQSLPRSAPTVVALDRIDASFPGRTSPAIVAVRTDTASPRLRQAVAGLQHQAAPPDAARSCIRGS